ncbi:Glutaredoxin-like domain protein [Candidatus Hydrogenisulfobacillus filiaventi]|uniref:Glutaredoxin-like domain protein n=1 Tax=Candidatus Hydrogenisulfobacillus filiaventi TaxID=2707344 RepID=A0A6F8ZGE0_9FIRM|nr:Glutaredoxin-like domain protein [Candidatus Hydrogenisulfobacillus filiaventi]
MAFLSERERRTLGEMLAGMRAPVRVALFTGGSPQWDGHARGLLHEVTARSRGQVQLEEYDRERDGTAAALYGVEETPTLVLLFPDGRDSGMRFVGVPLGYEFGTLINDLVDLSLDRHRVSDALAALARRLPPATTVDVFVTPTCPHCPRTVHWAHQLAALSGGRVRGRAVDALEFAAWADAQEVYAVPKTVVSNPQGQVVLALEGALPEAGWVDALAAAGGSLPPAGEGEVR